MIGDAYPALPGLETSVLKLSLWRFALYLLIILTGLAVALPFLPRDLAQSWPIAPVSLGLDLRGGASLPLRAGEAAIRAGLVSDFETALTDAAQAPTIRAAEGGNGLTVAVPDDMTPEAVTSLARQHLTELGGGPLQRAEPAFSHATGENTVVATLRPAAVALVQVDAVARSIEVIRNRIDEPGVALSSIFIAAAILLFLGDRRQRRVAGTCPFNTEPAQ